MCLKNAPKFWWNLICLDKAFSFIHWLLCDPYKDISVYSRYALLLLTIPIQLISLFCLALSIKGGDTMTLKVRI